MVLDKQLCLQNYILFDPLEEFPFCIHTNQLKKKKNQIKAKAEIEGEWDSYSQMILIQGLLFMLCADC